MIVSPEYVGRTCRPLEVRVTPRRAMNYAAAVEDDNPRYLDDTRPDGLLAPPMLAVALTWPISANFAEYWGDTGFPAEILARQVHYSEHIAWARPLRAEETLLVTGRVAAILPHRAGTHLVIEYTAADETGGTVFVERIGGLLRGVKCDGPGRGEEALRGGGDAPDDAPPLWEKTLPIPPLAAHWYDAGADIHFPIHTSPAFARFVGLPGILYHGTATLSRAVTALVNAEAGGDPARVREVSCLFTAMVFPGDDITLRLHARQPAEDGATRLAFTVENAEGKTALRAGSLLIGG
ncbi:MAG TPA: MaoC/PaaZ C-terminal domain-containing protein [Candidatus Hydrogenedentes bacterium]|nr:MaoC/PaaZ C-terminal domain-containing protein [Candidatus Hydrogenedentota bacterium]